MKEKIKLYLQKTRETKDLMFYSTHHMRVTTLYWYVAIARLIDYEIPDKDEIIDFILKCKNSDHLFGSNIGYPSTLVSTLNALQIFHILKYKYVDTNIITNLNKFVNDDGSVCNDEFKETDTRFICCLTMIMGLCQNKHLDKNTLIEDANQYIPVDKIIRYISQCQNEDGGFGAAINAESHAANTYCCLTSLKLLDCVDIDFDNILHFLVYKQNDDGGFCGRINKKSDSCYGFWAFASLVILNGDKYVDGDMLYQFTMSCYDEGAFADRPGNEPDLFHTLYALLTLSFLKKEGIRSGYPMFGF